MHNDIKKYELVDRLNLDRYVSTQTGIDRSIMKLGNQCVAATIRKTNWNIWRGRQFFECILLIFHSMEFRQCSVLHCDSIKEYYSYFLNKAPGKLINCKL